MAKEHYIIGKKDSGHHDGLYSNTKRLQEAEFSLNEFLSQPKENPTESAAGGVVLPTTEQTSKKSP